MEFSTLNGYKVKDKKAIRYYEDIDSMKNDSTLKEGMHVITQGYYNSGDGGHGEYIIVNDNTLVEDNGLIHNLTNGLKATLIVENDTINTKQYGIVDNTKDIGAIINKITNDLNYKAYVPTGEYLVTTTINPSGRKEILINGNLSYTGEGACIKIDSPYNKITTQKIISSGICILFENNNATSYCQNNIVTLNDLVRSTTTHAIKFHSILGGVVYNKLHFRTLRAESNSCCIYIKTENTGSVARYVAESEITGGQCNEGLYGVYIDTSTSGATGEVTGMHFNTISFEGVTNGVYISNARGNNFDYIRVGELSGHYLKLKDSAKNNIFNILSAITHDKINVSEMSTNDNHINIINGKYAASGGSLLANKIILTKQRIYLQELLNRSYKNIVSSPYTLTDDEARYYILVSNNESTINLNEYYGVNGISEFWVDSSRTFSLYDKDDNLICSNTAGPTSYLFHCVCYSKNGVDTWIVDKKEKS